MVSFSRGEFPNEVTCRSEMSRFRLEPHWDFLAISPNRHCVAALQ